MKTYLAVHEFLTALASPPPCCVITLGALISFVLSLCGVEMYLPANIWLLITFLSFAWAAFSAYHKLLNEKEVVDNELGEIKKPKLKISISNPFFIRGKHLFGWNVILWHFSNVTIINESRQFCVSLKEVKIKVTSIDEAKTSYMIFPQYNEQTTIPRNAYLNPSQTISGNIVFSEICPFADGTKTPEIVMDRKYSAIMYFIDNEEHEYKFTMSNTESARDIENEEKNQEEKTNP